MPADMPRGHDPRLEGPASSRATLLLWRHGVTDWNADHRFQGCNADIPLSSVGLEQARAAAPGVAAERPDAIVCSPMLRARQTCDAAASLLGLDVVYDDRLREIDVGQWCGRTPGDVLAADPAYAAAFAERRDYRMGVTGETRMELAARVGAALADRARDGRCVLVVAHGWALQMGVAHLLGWDYAQVLALRVMGNCAT
ncbi:MAG: histidine phosphatase family protein, partial [Actinomycetia bacterium]|nr:histidine phosphatase family protein [Actinomycetes bacterium]